MVFKKEEVTVFAASPSILKDGSYHSAGSEFSHHIFSNTQANWFCFGYTCSSPRKHSTRNTTGLRAFKINATSRPSPATSPIEMSQHSDSDDSSMPPSPTGMSEHSDFNGFPEEVYVLGETLPTEHGEHRAFRERQAAHPEGNVLAAGRPLTFEEYSNFFHLDPMEPMGSRISEFSVYFYKTRLSVLHPNFTVELLEEWRDNLERVATLIDATNCSTFQQNNNQTYFCWRTVYNYSLYVHRAACLLAWNAHVASGVPYGPLPRYFHGDPQFGYPGQAPLPPLSPPPPASELPTERTALRNEVGDVCAICRIPVEAGDTLMVLPCTNHAGDHPGHWFHPECITNWFEAVGRQQCVYFCPQRTLEPQAQAAPVAQPAVSPPNIYNLNDYNLSYTFADGANIIQVPPYW